MVCKDLKAILIYNKEISKGLMIRKCLIVLFSTFVGYCTDHVLYNIPLLQYLNL